MAAEGRAKITVCLGPATTWCHVVSTGWLHVVDALLRAADSNPLRA
jgi:hypothetical protein